MGRDIRKVLVADADSARRMRLRGLLEHHGFVVECASDAVAAIRLGLVFRPDILITDVGLADETSGIMAAAALSRHLESLRIVFSSELERRELEGRCDGLAVHAYLHPSDSPTRVLGVLDPP